MEDTVAATPIHLFSLVDMTCVLYSLVDMSSERQALLEMAFPEVRSFCSSLGLVFEVNVFP